MRDTISVSKRILVSESFLKGEFITSNLSNQLAFWS
jgi:hypothetical protein